MLPGLDLHWRSGIRGKPSRRNSQRYPRSGRFRGVAQLGALGQPRVRAWKTAWNLTRENPAGQIPGLHGKKLREHQKENPWMHPISKRQGLQQGSGVRVPRIYAAKSETGLRLLQTATPGISGGRNQVERSQTLWEAPKRPRRNSVGDVQATTLHREDFLREPTVREGDGRRTWADFLESGCGQNPAVELLQIRRPPSRELRQNGGTIRQATVNDRKGL